MANASTHTRSARRSTDEKKRELRVPLDPDEVHQLLKEGLIVRTGINEYRLSGAAPLLRFVDSKTGRRSRKPGM
jgi:hypothetical protein